MQKRVRLKDVAKAASVSEATASLAMADAPQVNDATRMRVQSLSRKMNYRPRPRKSLRSATPSQTSKRIGLVGLSPHAEETSFLENLKRLDQVRDDLNIRLELTMIQDVDPDQTRRRLTDAATEIDGLLLMGHLSRELLELTTTFNRPCVLLGNVAGDNPMNTNAPCAVVRSDPLAMGHQATRRLIELGHRRIGFFCRVPAPGLWYERWLSGYRYAHFDAGMPIDDDLIQLVDFGTYQTVGEIAVQKVLAMENPPTAFVLPAHGIARTFLDEMSKADQPVDPARVVIGGDLQMAERLNLKDYPLITEDYNRLARTCLEVLLAAIDKGEQSHGQIILPYQMHNFTSTGHRSDTAAK